MVVDETEFAVVTSFGRIAAVYGDQPSEAGLHAKAPWQLAIKIDRRFRVFDPPPREVMTGDKRNLEVAPYVVWRVADPVVFLRGSGSHELAEARLDERVSAGLSDAIGRRDLAEPGLDRRRRDGRSTTLTREVAGRRRARRARASWASRSSTSGCGGSTIPWRSARRSST